MLLYCEEGNPKKFVVPDVFVVKGTEPGLRRTYQTWVEGIAPQVVIEVTSRATRRIDEGRKPEVYAQIGVKELFLYDPTCDYLNPPLRGYRLRDGGMARILPERGGLLPSDELDLWLTRDGTDLVFIDRATDERVRTELEAAREEANVAMTKAAAWDLASAELRGAAEEIERLRQRLRQLGENGAGIGS